MKFNKEQVTFAVVMAIMAWLSWDTLSGDPKKTPRRPSRGASRFTSAVPELSSLPAVMVLAEENSWAGDGRNIYRAPTEESPLPPLVLPAPPRPPLPASAPTTIPGFDAFSRIGTVKSIQVVTGVELPPRVEQEEPEEPEETAAAAGQDPPDPQPGSQDAPIKDTRILNLRRRLQEDGLERIKREQEEREKNKEEIERRKGLDKVHWENGQTWYGTIVNDSALPEGAEGLDKYGLKIELDRIRADLELSTSQRDEALQRKDLYVQFRRDNNGTLGTRQTYPASNVRAIEFSDHPVNVFQLARRQTDYNQVDRHLELVHDLMVAGENTIAKKHLESLLKLGHRERGVFVALAEAGRQSFDVESQLHALSEGLKLYEGDADLMAQLGDLYSRLGLGTKAESSFSQASSLAPRSVRVNSLYGAHILTRGFMKKSDGADAVERLSLAQTGRFEVVADRRRVLLDLGRAALATGNLDIARRNYVRVNEEDPANVEAMVGLGAVAYAAGEFATAKTHFESSIAKDPFNGRAWFNLALCSLAEEQWVAARDQLHDAMSADPLLTARCHAALGFLNERLGKPQDALSSYQAAQQADPLDPDVHMLVGRGHLLTGNHQAAEEQLLSSLETRPNQFDTLAGLAEVSFMLGRYPDSLRYTDAALQLAQDSGTLLVRRAQTLAKLNRFDEAKKCLDQAKMSGDSFEVELTLAWYYYTEGNSQEALKRFGNVVKGLDRKDKSPLAVYARRYVQEIEDNLAKTLWTDHFDRVSVANDLSRGWESYQPGSGISVSLVKNRVVFTGTQRQSEVPSCIFQQRQGNEFVSFDATLHADRSGAFTCGVGLFTFRKTQKPSNPFVDKLSNNVAYEGLLVGKNPEGRIAWRSITKSEMSRWQPISGQAWPASQDGEPQPVQLGIVLQDAKKGIFAVTVNGEVVAEGISLARLARSAKNLQLWVFTQSEIEKRIDMKVDDVRIVRRKYKEVR